MKHNPLQILEQAHRDLRPDADLPGLKVEFFPFTSIKNTIRMREGKLLVRLSDLLEGAPAPVLRALAHILLAKMYRRPIDSESAARYRKYVSSRHVSRRPTWCARCADASVSTPPRAAPMTWKLYLKSSTRGSFMASWPAPR